MLNDDVCQKIAKCPQNLSISIFHSLYEEKDFICPDSHLPHHLQTLQAIGSGNLKKKSSIKIKDLARFLDF